MSSSGSKKLGSVRAGASLKASMHGDEMGEMSPAQFSMGPTSTRHLQHIRNRSTRNASFANTLAVASNYELAAMRHGFDPHHEGTLKDF